MENMEITRPGEFFSTSNLQEKTVIINYIDIEEEESPNSATGSDELSAILLINMQASSCKITANVFPEFP